MARRLRTLAFALFAPALAACNDLPEAAYIEYTRLLGIKVGVVASPLREINPADPRPFAQALPFETVQLREWVVTPQGPLPQGSLGGRWLACERIPQTGTGDCLRGYIRKKDPVLRNIQTCTTPKLDGLNNVRQAGQAPELPTRTPPCFLPANQRPSQFTVPVSLNMLLGASIEIWYFASLPGTGPGTATCISDLLGGNHQLNDNCLYGVTDLDLGPRTLMKELLDSAGIGPSTDTPPEPSENQTPNTPEPPPQEGNRNPRIASVAYTIEQDGAPVTATQVLKQGEIITAPIGSSLRLDVTLPESELQTFQVPVNDGERILVRTEEYDSTWFYTWGSLEGGSDRPEVAVERWKLSTNTDNRQSDRNPGQNVYAYFAVRDERGGMDWYNVNVRLAPKATQSTPTPSSWLAAP